jgi:hypothetical protein
MAPMNTNDARSCTNFWLFSFSAPGPALIRRSRSFGSFFHRYVVINAADAAKTHKYTCFYLPLPVSIDPMLNCNA